MSSWRRSATGPALVEKTVAGGAEAWEASFCKAVMLSKEEAKRERERR